jgi:hypothetical protein
MRAAHAAEGHPATTHAAKATMHATAEATMATTDTAAAEATMAAAETAAAETTTAMPAPATTTTTAASGENGWSNRHGRGNRRRDEASKKPVLHRNILHGWRRYAARGRSDEANGHLPSTYKCARF